jgi:hypothetical protein
MNLFRRSRPQQVVRSYGRDSLLVLLNPIIAALQATVGLRVGLRSDAEVLQEMELDAQKMQQRGYRVASADQHDLPVLGPPGRKATYYRVTYELVTDR